MTSTNKRTILAVLSVLTILSGANAQDNSQGNIVTNKFLDNWEVSFGVEHLSFYSPAEGYLNLPKSPFSSVRSNFGATAAIGKWFSPEIGLRTKANGYWGKRIVGANNLANSIRFFYIQEQVLLNATNIFTGYNPQRIWNGIPFIGIGFMRDCTNNDNSFGIALGLTNRFRISDQMKIHFDLSYAFAGSKKEDPASLYGRYRYLGMELGLTFNLGKNKWNKKKDNGDRQLLTYDTYSMLTSDSKTISNPDQMIVEQNTIPTGMVLINRGHLRMGIDNPEELWGNGTPVRDISVDDFWMDRTEVTNKQYRQFVNFVLDSIINKRMKAPMYNNDREKVLESLYITNPVTGEKKIDGRQLNYKYEVYDYVREALRKHRLNPSERNLNTDLTVNPNEVILISKDTAYVDAWGNITRKSITRPLSGPYDFLNTYIVNIYPDTTCWINDFPNADNEMYLRYYWNRKEYENYPVVGVTWEQANAYCAWRTEMMHKELGKEGETEQRFRLPTEAEWEYAARGRFQNEFPWAKEFRDKGFHFANFMADEGNLTKDGNIITSQVGIYAPNSNDLYDMAGNVAEWTSTAFTDAGVEAMNVINPQLRYDAAPEDPYHLKKKTVKGGSWKDPESHIRSASRTNEYQNQPRSYIGFRCVRSIATTPSERTVLSITTTKKKK